MQQQKTAIIRHTDGTSTNLDVEPTASVFGSDVYDRWVLIPPDGFTAREGDTLDTDLAPGSFDWATPIADVLPGLARTEI